MLKHLRQANLLRQTEWENPANPPSLTYFGNELAGECGETCNAIKKIERARLGMRGSKATVKDLADELADVVIVTDLIANSAGINLGEAIIEKFNATSEKYGLTVRLFGHGVLRLPPDADVKTA
jgi:NTP pyrophosphatase (non-canonical NTP hydrolase)